MSNDHICIDGQVYQHADMICVDCGANCAGAFEGTGEKGKFRCQDCRHRRLYGVAREDIRATLERVYQAFVRDRTAQSWFMQPPAEKKRRMQAVLALAAELEKIKAVHIFGTALGEAAIERIIEGDWRGAEEYVDELSFCDSPAPEGDAQRELWSKFVAVLGAAIRNETPS